jgi:diguanylate cyclase (GGDEF)-like protein
MAVSSDIIGRGDGDLGTSSLGGDPVTVQKAVATVEAASSATSSAKPAPDVGVDASLGALKAAMNELTSCVEDQATWVRLSAAAREVEVRARHLANLLEDHTVPLPARFDPLPFSGTTQSVDGFRVLVVDDEVDQAELIACALSPWFRVRTAHDGLEAAELVREEPPDVIVTDLNMPRAGGLALMELVRSNDATAQIPLVVVSGRSDLDSKVNAFESGAFDFISKPVTAGELVARVRNALAHSQVLRRERILGGRDDLTGLANRRTFRTFLDAALRAARVQRLPLVLVLADQDRLKWINDTYGHPTGDEALKLLGQALATSTRGSDCAARVGGDEFALVMPGCDRDGAARLLSRVEESLRRKPLPVHNGKSIEVEASFGLVCYGDAGYDETPEQLIRRADAELYERKRAKAGAIAASAGR